MEIKKSVTVQSVTSTLARTFLDPAVMMCML